VTGVALRSAYKQSDSLCICDWLTGYFVFFICNKIIATMKCTL